MLGAFVQVFLAVVIVILLFMFAFFIYNREVIQAIQNSSKKTQVVPIFSGIIDLADVKNRVINTRDTSHPTYKSLNPSYNQASGAEFTYNFWLYTDHDALDDIDEDTVVKTDSGIETGDLVLLLKGDKTSYSYKNACGQPKTDVMIKCPLIKLQRGGDVLSVEFNTLSSPDAVREQSRNTCHEQSVDWKYMNAHKLAISGLRNGPNAANYSKKWYMVTVVIQDTNPLDPLPMRNKCRCRIFVNGTLELDRYVDGSIGSWSRDASVLRQNQGNLHIAPTVSFTPQGSSTPTTTLDISSQNHSRKIMMADLTYLNYALDPASISNKFKEGFNKSFATLVDVTAYDPLKGANTASLSAGSDRKQLMGF